MSGSEQQVQHVLVMCWSEQRMQHPSSRQGEKAWGQSDIRISRQSQCDEGEAQPWCDL